MLEGYKVGDRVKVQPWHDMFMCGARYGNIAKVGRKFLTVELDAGIEYRFRPDNIEVIERRI